MSEHSRVKLILQEGEGLKIEFKKNPNRLDRELVALANSAGGSIFLGVSDDGKITGVKLTNTLKSQVTDAARNCDPSIPIKLVSHKELHILEIQIDEGQDKPYRCSEGFFLRIGPNTQKLKRDDIIDLVAKTEKFRFDGAINEKFNFSTDFSRNKLDKFLALCDLKPENQVSEESILISLGVVDQQSTNINNAGILFFAKDPQKFFPEAYITAALYKTSDRLPIIDKKDFAGSPIDQIEDSMNFFMRHINAELSVDSLRHDKIYDYPPNALREAMVNAVTHRDYLYDGAHIYINMFPEHIDIESSGELYRGMTEENLGHRSVRRNRLIADLLHRAHYIERVGSGFNRMKHALNENKNPPYQVTNSNFFNIRFQKRVDDPSILLLSSRQKKLYGMIKPKASVSKRDVSHFLNVSEDTALRKLNHLLKLKILQKHGVGKATVYSLKKHK